MAERPKVGDRVRVVWVSSEYHGQYGTLQRDDNDGVPYLVKLEGGNKCWFAEAHIVAAPEPQPERPPTEIELRLRKLEELLDRHNELRQHVLSKGVLQEDLQARVQKLEAKLATNDKDVTDLSGMVADRGRDQDRIKNALATLERQMTVIKNAVVDLNSFL